MKIGIFVMIIFINVLTYAEPSLKISTTKLNTANIETQISEPLEINEANNTACPVDRNEIIPENKATYEYNGTLYNFCDPKCINKFMQNPEGYIATP